MKDDSMKAAVVTSQGEIEVKEIERPEPEENEVLVEVEASGVCHSDVFTVEQMRPDVELPRIPGHEVVGTVSETGDGVEEWDEGDRVGVGWHGGYCGRCSECRQGNLNMCPNGEITGVTRDGGHAEYLTARSEALASVPDSLESVEAAPLLCAGVTTFNALRHTEASSGDTVAVVGLGGLGHLGLQYAARSGFRTVAVSRSAEKEEYAEELGADEFIDSSSGDVSERLNDLGGADVVLVTAPAAEAVEQVMQGLATDAEVTVVGVPGRELEIDVADLIGSRASVTGWASGHASDSEDTMEFSELEDVETEIERFSLEEYEKAYDRMMEGEVRFRAVLEP